MRSFKDYFFQTTDGLRLYARDYPGPDASAPALLCLHGLTRNSKDFESLAQALASDFRVVVPEQCGRGLSDYAEDVSRYSLLQYVEDMQGLIVELGLQRLSVVGTSMGGLMTIALNALSPSLIERAVINDIGPEIAQAGLDRIKCYVGVAGPFEDWEEATAYLMSITAEFFPDWTDAQWSDFARQCYIEREDHIVIDYDPRIATPLATQSSDTEAETLWSLFESMSSVPSLLVRGELTDLLSLECVARMQKVHPSMEVLSVPNVGHAPMLNEPGVTEAIRRFLLD
ncbi:alpha/beta hydrolase [Luminiphilus sp.]|nr:alpha/beta hydrolase [Luminiphilus sp.]